MRILVLGLLQAISALNHETIGRGKLLPAGPEGLVIVRWFADPLRDVPRRCRHVPFRRIGPSRRSLLPDWLAHCIHGDNAIAMFAEPDLYGGRGCGGQIARAAFSVFCTIRLGGSLRTEHPIVNRVAAITDKSFIHLI